MAESDLYMQCDEDDLEPCQSFTENRNQIYNKGNFFFFKFYCKYSCNMYCCIVQIYVVQKALKCFRNSIKSYIMSVNTNKSVITFCLFILFLVTVVPSGNDALIPIESDGTSEPTSVTTDPTNQAVPLASGKKEQASI